MSYLTACGKKQKTGRPFSTSFQSTLVLALPWHLLLLNNHEQRAALQHNINGFPAENIPCNSSANRFICREKGKNVKLASNPRMKENMENFAS